MKKLLTIFLFFISYFISAQFDTEHWFAPMADASNGSEAQQYIYVSTNESTPFKVDIYNNNVIIGTINNLSKGSPQKFYIPREYIITSNNTEINAKATLGLHLVGEKKFFANLRFSVSNHAEILTSKGKSALGKNFYIGMGEQYIPTRIDYINGLNAIASVIATENNTTIKLSGYNKDVIFSDGSTDDEKTIILNKGESYIFETRVSDATANLDGLIGANLSADKPVSVTNGNFLSVAENKANYDILMDQSAPTDRLGTEYVVLKGNGTASGLTDGYTEKSLVIATEDNTEVYINGATTPTTTLSKGQFYFIRGNFYNPSGNIYNLYIKSTKPIYVYQFLAGTDGTDGTPEFATGGFNFIPALSCYLPSSIDEIGFVSEMPYLSNFENYYNTKLNIITEKGATVSINGTPINSSFGPFALSGNSSWETYVVPNVSGNVTIKSTRSVTAGIAAGNGAVGYGGYFAGFNSVPIISKGGDCEKGNVTLEVDNTYDGYQWYYNGIPYTGPGANTYIISPTESGDYYVKITKASCGSLDSPIFSFQRCPFKSFNSVEISNCNPTYTTDTPTFSVSTQTVDYSTVEITTPPSNGTVTINTTTGEITYTLTNFSATTDTFTYSFSGTDPKFPDTEFVTVNININYLRVFTGETFACIKPDNKGDFDLTQATISSDSNIKNIEYYENYISATKTFSNLISNSTSYNSIPKTVFAKVTNSFGCVEVANIELKFYPIPNINTIRYNSTLCDIDFDGLYEPDFNEISNTIVNNSADFDIYYSLTNDFSAANRLSNNWSYSAPTRVYVLVASRNGCTNATGFLDFKIGTKITVNNIETAVCDNERDGKTNIIISDYLPTTTSGTQYFYYNSFQKAQEAIVGTTTPDNQEITNNTTFYIRTENPGFCPNIFELQIIFNQPETSSKIHDLTICKNTTTTINAGTNFTYYKWSNETEGQFAEEAEYGVGTHFVELTSQNGCVYKQTFTISEAEDPTFDSVLELGNSITVNISGGKPPYEYSLNKINWRSSNVFNNLKRGLQVVYVRDSYKCNPIEYEFLIFNQINAITPNGDGINDVLDYSDLKVKKDVKILIFDRYGRKVYSNEKQSTYIWDGTSNGRVLPTGTYWYILEWTEPDNGAKLSFKDWILVKNRN